MQKRRLGQTDLWLSPLGLGTVKFGRNENVKYPDYFELPSDEKILHLLTIAKEKGINVLDTAPAYGISETRLGKLLKGERKDWIISTKVGEEFINGQSHFDFSPLYLRKSIEQSLIRLQTDYLDVVLVHSNGNDQEIIKNDNVFHTLTTLKAAGKIRSFGMSTKTIKGGFLTVEQADVVMVAYHPTYLEEEAVLDYAQAHQKGVLVKKALASGHQPMINEALNFIFKKESVTSVIIGTINPVHLEQNIASFLKVSQTKGKK